MEDAAKVAICRMVCGVALLVTHAVTGVDSALVAIALFLLGVPVEYIEASKKPKSEESK